GACGDGAELVVVVGAAADGVLEDRGIRRHAPEAVVDERLQLAGAQHSPAQIIQPYALTLLEQGLHGRLGGAFGHTALQPSDFPVRFRYLNLLAISASGRCRPGEASPVT